MCDIISTADVITYTLSPQTTVFMMPHLLHAWHYTLCIRHCTNCIFFITTSPLISHPLLNDITPTFCVTSYALYITSHPSLCYHTTLLMTSQPLYVKPHPVCRATYTLYMRHHSHYLCPHTHSIDNITPNFCMTSLSLYMRHRLHYTRHHILILWCKNNVFMSSHPLYLTSCHCICVTTSTGLMISHPLYFWDHILYNSWHHIHCIRHDTHRICVITPARLKISLPISV